MSFFVGPHTQIFLDFQNERSEKKALVEDDESSIWLVQKFPFTFIMHISYDPDSGLSGITRAFYV